jgi:hypothetical protein
MCIYLYLGTSRHVPRQPSREGAPLGVRDLTADEAPVLQRLGTSQACAIESWETSCACAFWRGSQPAEDDDEREEQRRNSTSIDALAVLLSECLRSEPGVRLYSCWTGDEGEPVESMRHVDLTHFAATVFELREGELLIIGA